MLEKLKDAGTYALGIAGFLLLLTIPMFLLMGSVWIGTRALPWLKVSMWVVLCVDVIFIFPLVLIRKTRELGLAGLLMSSYVFGLFLWFWGLLLSYYIWGFIALFIGLAMWGVGVVPVAMLATFLTGEFGTLGGLILLTVLTFGVRFFSLYVLEKSTDGANLLEGDEKPKGRKWPIIVGILFWLFAVTYLAGTILGAQTCTEIDDNTLECTPTFLSGSPSTIEVYDKANNSTSVYDKGTGELIESY